MGCLCVDLTGDEVLYGLLVCGFVDWCDLIYLFIYLFIYLSIFFFFFLHVKDS